MSAPRTFRSPVYAGATDEDIIASGLQSDRLLVQELAHRLQQLRIYTEAMDYEASIKELMSDIEHLECDNEELKKALQDCER